MAGISNGVTISDGVTLVTGCILGQSLIILPNGLAEGYGTISGGDVSNDGTILATGGQLEITGDVSGSGTAEIDNDATLTLDGSFAQSGTVSFASNDQGTLVLNEPQEFDGTIAGIGFGDTIDLPAGELSGDIAHTQITGSDLDLTFSDGAVWQYQLQGDYTGDVFDILETGNDGKGNPTDTDLVLRQANPQITTGVDGAPTSNPYINALIWGWGAWNPSEGPITYWFGSQSDLAGDVPVHGATTYITDSSTVDAWTTQEEDDFIAALQDYSTVSNLTFAPATSAETADMVWWLDPALGPEASDLDGLAEVPAQLPGGQLWLYFNDQPWTADPDVLSLGGDGNDTIVHELGHALGLAHPHDGGAEPDANTFPGVPVGDSDETGLYGQNQAIYTVMSYNQGWDGETPSPPPSDYGTQAALGAFDIAALQELYGANDAANPGDDTYVLPTTNAPGTGWSCIWDPNGVNTISAGDTTFDVTIDLRAAPLTGPNAGGYQSYTEGILGGYTIANGSTIQDAIGGSGDDTFVVNQYADTITGGGGSDTVDFPNPLADYTLTRSGDEVLATDSGVTDTLYDITTLQFSDQSIPTESIPCFVQGTRLVRGPTESEECPVENLVVGDLVRSAVQRATRIVWLGHRRVDCRRHPRPHDVWPVRIHTNAFGPRMPHRDLLLSPDHAVFIDGVLIPIRYLINGATIIQEPTDEVTYWHVELSRHDVLLAEGLPCESYLDTGNRGAFENGGRPVHLHPDFALRIWEADACAKLVRDGAELIAARSFLLERAELLGHAWTREPDLQLHVNGRILRPIVAGNTYRFRLPRHACNVRLVSRCSVPADVRDDSDDCRELGVAVSRIVVDEETIALNEGRLGAGWHAVEHSGPQTIWRWTNGDAELVLSGGRILTVEVIMTSRYWRDAGMPLLRAA